MKAESLRIGNIIDIAFLDGSMRKNTPLNKRQLIGILKDEFLFKEVELDSLWLEKMGFEYDKNILGWDNSDVVIQDWKHCNEFHYVGNSGDLDRKIEYVHQLQNLYFALTGKELEIKQFEKV